MEEESHMDALARARERTARFKQLLADGEWDAIVARSGKNVVYLPSLPISGTLARLQDFPDSPRFALVAWPREGAPTLIVTRLHEDVYHQEAPILHPGETWPLEANMVVVLEPSIDAYHIQDEIPITPAGPRLLSDRFNTDEMSVMG
jgi:Xaa-Pro aminopeptidase